MDLISDINIAGNLKENIKNDDYYVEYDDGLIYLTQCDWVRFNEEKYEIYFYRNPYGSPQRKVKFDYKQRAKFLHLKKLILKKLKRPLLKAIK